MILMRTQTAVAIGFMACAGWEVNWKSTDARINPVAVKIP
jgi:hypothetical protein